jgi:hypothetical protein
MATTTNYGWTTPDDTDLVKDGAAAIRTLGSSIDTTTKNLNPETTTGDIAYRSATANTNTRLAIGTTGQVLTVAGGVPTWATSDDANAIQNAIVDAKGDIVAASANDTPARLAVGTDNHRLVAASGETTGLKYVADTQNTVIDAAGDLLYGTADNTVGRLAIGTAGQVLKVNSGATAPEWGAASGAATFVGASVFNTTDQTLSNNTFTAVTFNSENWDTDSFHSTSSNTSRMTIPSGKNGKYLISGTLAYTGNATGARGFFIYKNGAAIHYIQIASSANSVYPNASMVVDAVATDYFEVYAWQNSGGNLDLIGGTTNEQLQITYLGA